MATIVICDADGVSHYLAAEDGKTVAEIVVANDIPGVDIECAGACFCATCHGFIADEWVDKLPMMSGDEDKTLDRAENRKRSSRLLCQVRFTETLDGLHILLESD